MQNLDIISVNLWQILISLCNLTLLFLIIKKFLFGPVTKMLKKRQDEIAEEYREVDAANREAQAAKEKLEAELGGARVRAEEIIKSAADTAELRGEKIVAEARNEAEGIIRQAKVAAEQEMRSAQASIKGEIVGVSTILAEKLLEREINSHDHAQFIDSFIEKIGEEE